MVEMVTPSEPIAAILKDYGGIQRYLQKHNRDESAPYMISKEAMDTCVERSDPHPPHPRYHHRHSTPLNTTPHHTHLRYTHLRHTTPTSVTPSHTHHDTSTTHRPPTH
jgi:hypothetical protein